MIEELRLLRHSPKGASEVMNIVSFYARIIYLYFARCWLIKTQKQFDYCGLTAARRPNYADSLANTDAKAYIFQNYFASVLIFE